MKKATVLIIMLVLVLSAFVGASVALAYQEAGDESIPTLFDAVVWVLHGGGAGVIAYILMDKVPFLVSLKPEPKRYASIALVAIITLAFWGFGMLMGYMPIPGHWREWLEVAFSTLFVALTTSLLVHGRRDLRKRP